MPYVIRVVGLVSGESSEDEARYLCRLQDRSSGLSFLSTTADRGAALRFASPEAAFEFWCQGPLGNFHASIEAVDPQPARTP